MITDLDLDAQNYADSLVALESDEVFLYIRWDDNHSVFAINGIPNELCNALINTEQLDDVILNCAAWLCINKKIDFEDFLKAQK